MATDNDVHAQTAIDEVERQYHAAVTKAGAPASAVQGLIQKIPLVNLIGDDESVRTALANLEKLRPRIDRWEQVYRVWAQHGARDTDSGDGTPYAWPGFFDEGKALASEVRTENGVAFDSSAFGVIAQTVEATAQDAAELPGKVADAVNPAKWGTAVKLGAGAAVVLVVLFALRRIL